MFAFDLISLAELNCLLKYADDVTLLNPGNAVVFMDTEVAHVMEWARQNKMSINMAKTKEIIFHRSNAKLIIFPYEMNNKSTV
jgi:hypothetical protein